MVNYSTNINKTKDSINSDGHSTNINKTKDSIKTVMVKTNINKTKDSINSDGQLFHQYQQNKKQ